VYSANLHKHYLLLDPDWKEDIMPEIMDGHNIADFIDADILQRLDELEREEEEAAATAQAADEDEDMSDQVPPQDTYPNQISFVDFCSWSKFCMHTFLKLDF
jgi:nucleolar GTP-binding protein